MSAMRSRHRYRCRTCRSAGRNYGFTLRRGPSFYKNLKCSRCGSENVFSYEEQYQKTVARRKSNICNCDFVMFPHEKATHKLCKFYPHEYPLTPEVEELLQDMHRVMIENKTRTRNF